MNNLLNKDQHKKLRFVFMWHDDWQKALYSDNAHMSYDEMIEREERMKWSAYMAVRDCEDVGLNPELLFCETMMKHAKQYRNEVLPKQMEMTRKELEDEGII